MKKLKMRGWRKSKGRQLWFYKPADNPTPTMPTKAVLNAVKFGTSYDIYLAINGLGNWRKLKRVKDRKEAIKYMDKYMEKH